MYNNLFGRDPERSMDCNFLLFFPQFQLCCCAPCHQSDHNIISKDQIVVGESIPAFLWLKCTNGQDCSELLLKYGIATRGGPSFGVSSAFVRLSLLDRDPLFDLLLQRLASIR
jgi:hypothetical protein